MNYVLDTGFFRICRDYYPDTFPSFWKNLNEIIEDEKASSVSEVKKELLIYKGSQIHLVKWIKDNPAVFSQPNEEELQAVVEILRIRKFRSLVNKKNIMRGSAAADPFIIAKAQVLEGVVVTTEEKAKIDMSGRIQGPLKIPDVCAQLEIGCINPETFMRELGWEF